MAETKARQVLTSCPFCNKAMQYRAALFVSDGCTDAVIHAEHTDCGLVQFDIGATDGGVSTIAAWNRRATDPAVPELVEALRRALPSVQSDAEMMDAIDRHNPLPAADMPAVTKAANELDVLVDDIRALLAKHAAKP